MSDELVGREHDVRAITDLIGGGRGVLLVGEPGVGKSRLAQHVATAIAAERGGTVEIIAGTVPGRTVTLGAVAHLIEPAPGINEAIVLGQVSARLEELVAEGGMVVVDDIDLLDDASRVAIHRLSSRVPILATSRTGDADDPFVVGLWKDRLVERLDVTTIDRTGSNEIARSSLGGVDLDPALADELWVRAAGNPLLIRELCAAGEHAGAITERDGTWRLDGALQAGDRIVDLIRDRLHELDEARSVVLAGITLLDPMPVEFADRLGDRDHLDDLARQRLVIELNAGDREVLRPAHPIVAEAVRATLSSARLAALADRLDGFEASDLQPVDARRVAGTLLLADRTPGPAMALAGAMSSLASFDHVAAEQLAGAALAHRSILDPSAESTAYRILGQALAGRGDIEAATEALERAAHVAPSDELRIGAIQTQAEILMFAAGRPHEAITRLRSLLDAMDPTAPSSALVRLQLALASGIVDELQTADHLAAELVASEQLPPPAMLPALMVHTLTRSMSGDVDGIEGALDRGDALALQFRTTQPLGRDQFGLNRVLAEQARGAVEASAALVRSVREADDFGDRAQGPWYYVDVPAAYARGDVAAVLDDIERAIELHRIADPTGTLALALAIGGVANAVAGDLVRARELIDDCIGVGGEHQARSRVWMGLAEAWLLAADGDLDAAAHHAIEVGRQAIDAWHIVWGAIAVHAACRFGRADLAAPVIGHLDAGPLVALLAAHATAESPEALAKAAAQFSDAGMHALAADAWAELAQSDADPLIVTASAMRAVTIGGRCDGPSTPMLARVESPLSPRQQEIAELAGRGRTSREIADELFVSTKTVDNHLQSIYRTLGIGSRSELAALVAD